MATAQTFWRPGRSATELVNTFPNAAQPGGYQVQVGDFMHSYTMSLSNELTWKNFRVYGLIEWDRGGNEINLTQQYFDTGPQLGTDSAAVAETATTGSPPGRRSTSSPRASSRFARSRVSYTLPARLVNTIGSWSPGERSAQCERLQPVVRLQLRGLDPEVSAFGNQAVGRGYNVTPYPPAKSLFFGLNLGL